MSLKLHIRYKKIRILHENTEKKFNGTAYLFCPHADISNSGRDPQENVLERK
jgi:hypothetical protein